MKKAMLGGEGKSNVQKVGMPKEILTHITSAHGKPNIFQGESGEKNHPKASSKMANCGDCN